MISSAFILVLISTLSVLAKAEASCDMITDETLCLYSGDKVVTLDAHQDGLVLRLTFDTETLYDTSGNKNHPITQVDTFNSGVLGHGYSAEIVEENYIEVEDSEGFDTDEYSVSFWAYIIETDGSGFCSLAVKGSADHDKSAPGIFINEATGQLLVTVSTEDGQEELYSNAKVETGRWYHIAVVRMERKVKLYVNGLVDSAVSTETNLLNHENLYIGGKYTHGSTDSCGLSWLVDNFQFFNRELEQSEVQAEGYPALGGVEPSYVELGCADCSLDEAGEVCNDGYHVCSKMEYFGGGYLVARIMGWVEYTTYVYTYQDVLSGTTETADGESVEDDSIALCCID